jgi:hypothetical protein
MHHDIIDVIKNIQDLYENNSSLAVLKDFERVLDEMDVYVYENWESGELAYGPKVDRHWITTGFMWPRDKMPNPIAGKRLTELGCKVTYQKTHLLEPREIRTPDDLRPNTKKGKLDRNPIWVVEVQMPKKVAFDIYKGYMDKMKHKDEENAPTENANPAATAQAAPMPAAAPGGMPPAGGAGGMPPAGGAPGGAPGGMPV